MRLERKNQVASVVWLCAKSKENMTVPLVSGTFFVDVVWILFIVIYVGRSKRITSGGYVYHALNRKQLAAAKLNLKVPLRLRGNPKKCT